MVEQKVARIVFAFAAAAGVALLTLFAVADDAEATHFRGMTLEWETEQQITLFDELLDEERVDTIYVTGTQTWRASSMGPVPVGACAAVGGSIFDSEGGRHPVALQVTMVDSASDTLFGTIMDSSCDGPIEIVAPIDSAALNVSYANCCFSTANMNNPSGTLRAEASIPLDRPRQSPAALPAWKNGSSATTDCPRDAICNLDFQSLGGTDYRIAKPCLLSKSCTWNHIGSPWANAPNLTSSGLLSWDTRGAAERPSTWGPTTYSLGLALGGAETSVPVYADIRIVDAPVQFAITNTPAYGGAPVQFGINQSIAGTIDSVSWDFGDGVTGTGTTPSHTFAIGTYNVSAAITWKDGHTYFAEAVLVVADPPPVADFEFSADGKKVQFTDLSTDNVAVVAWHWDFGNGKQSDDQHPTTKFTWGSYAVTLTVTDNLGATHSVTKQLHVAKP